MHPPRWCHPVKERRSICKLNNCAHWDHLADNSMVFILFYHIYIYNNTYIYLYSFILQSIPRFPWFHYIPMELIYHHQCQRIGESQVTLGTVTVISFSLKLPFDGSFHYIPATRWCPSSLAKLVPVTPISMLYGRYIWVIFLYFTNLNWGHLGMIPLTNHDSSEVAVRSL